MPLHVHYNKNFKFCIQLSQQLSNKSFPLFIAINTDNHEDSVNVSNLCLMDQMLLKW